LRQGDDALHRASGFPELLQKHLLTGFFALTTLADFFFKVIGALLVPNGGVHELFLQVVDALLLLSHGGVAREKLLHNHLSRRQRWNWIRTCRVSETNKVDKFDSPAAGSLEVVSEGAASCDNSVRFAHGAVV